MQLTQQFEDTRDMTSQQLSQLGAAVSTKADSAWMEKLEQSVRDEVERLRASGKAVITKPELEKKLAELRAKMAQQGERAVSILESVHID